MRIVEPDISKQTEIKDIKKKQEKSTSKEQKKTKTQ